MSDTLNGQYGSVSAVFIRTWARAMKIITNFDFHIMISSVVNFHSNASEYGQNSVRYVHGRIGTNHDPRYVVPILILAGPIIIDIHN